MDSLGRKIRDLRKERKMTQWALARGLVTASMISQIESDKATPSEQLLEQLAARLGVKPSYFADDFTHKTDLTQTYRRAKQLMESENYTAALPLLLTLINPIPAQFREETLYADLAQCYERLHQYKEATNMYEEVIRCALERDDVPGAVHSYFRIGQLERRQNRLALARMNWQRAAELLRRHPDISMPLAMKIYSNLGRIHMQLRDFDLSIESYRRAAVLAERYEAQLDHAMILHGMGAAYIELGEFERGTRRLHEAIAIYEVIRHQRGINQCYVNLGVGLRRAGKLKEARAQFDWCIDHPEIQVDVLRLANALCERATCSLELGDLDAAVRDAEEAVVLDNDTAEVQVHARHTLAAVYAERKQWSKSLEHVNVAIEHVHRMNDTTLCTELHRIRAQAHHALGNEAACHADGLHIARLVLQTQGIS